MQIVGPFASDAFVCAFRLQHGAAIRETQPTQTLLLLAGDQDTERAHFWYAKAVVTDLWLPRNFADVTLLCAPPPTVLQCQLGWSSDPPTLRTGPATLELKAKCKWAALSTAALWHGAGGAGSRTRSISFLVQHLNHEILPLVASLSKLLVPLDRGLKRNKAPANFLHKPLSFGQGDGKSHPISYCCWHPLGLIWCGLLMPSRGR